MQTPAFASAAAFLCSCGTPSICPALFYTETVIHLHNPYDFGSEKVFALHIARATAIRKKVFHIFHRVFHRFYVNQFLLKKVPIWGIIPFIVFFEQP